MTIGTEHSRPLTTNLFDIQYADGAISSLKYKQDSFDTEYILANHLFGHLFLKFRNKDGAWNCLSTLELAQQGKANMIFSDNSHYETSYQTGSLCQPDLDIHTSFQLHNEMLLYTIQLKNCTNQELEIGDLSIPFLMNSAYEWGTKPHESVLRHCFISGHNSYMFWMRCNSAGPYLAMTLNGHTKLEYFDLYKESDDSGGKRQFRAYIHSAVEGQKARERGTKWRQPHTSIILSPQEDESSMVSYTFQFQWVPDYDAMRDVIVESGQIDTQVIPGMTVPTDLFAKFYLRTTEKMESVSAEYPEETELEYLEEQSKDTHLYKVKFGRLGENRLTIRYGDGKESYLEFFVTEPLETLIKKRASFIAKKQHLDPSKWYNGLLAEWNMDTKVMLGPDNYDRIKGWRIYEVTCDDPGLCKPAFLAAKNAEIPNSEEIEALEYYIEHFVWGGLQRTDKEEYSYGIYGIPDWHILRNSEDEGPKGKTHIWRIYDYPHIALLYWSMYRLKKNHPQMKTKFSKELYLERAYQTAIAMFTIPVETGDWSAYHTGLYNELILVDLIEELKNINLPEKAFRLEKHWQKKVSHFVNEDADLFGSEYPFDSTGFETTHAIAKYALKAALQSVSEIEDSSLLEKDEAYSRATKFMETQMKANLFCRGWLSPAYYLYGSDYRGESNAAYTLSYMSQMGGWAVLDYGLRYSTKPHNYIRLGYASLLSSWALMNTGTKESDYGYWYPGEDNDGACGGGFEPSPYGHTWLEQGHHRGSWYYSCEIDLGYCGALRGSATVVTDDPIFGLFCYGGLLVEKARSYEITMKDGIRKKLHFLINEMNFEIKLENRRFAAESPVTVQRDFSEIQFELESVPDKDLQLMLSIDGLPDGEYGVYSGVTKQCSIRGGIKSEFTLLAGSDLYIKIQKEGEVRF